MQLDEEQGSAVGEQCQGYYGDCVPICSAFGSPWRWQLSVHAVARQRLLPCISMPPGTQAENVPRTGG